MKKIVFVLFFNLFFCVMSVLAYNPFIDLKLFFAKSSKCVPVGTPANILVFVEIDLSGIPVYSSYGAPINTCNYNSSGSGWIVYESIWGIYPSYKNCPEGQEIINGVCSVPPSCPSGQLWDSVSDSCIPAPAPDSDGDGTPDKCDYDSLDFKTLDCDGDGIPNNNDDDLDGDGTNNNLDADSNGDNKPDSSDPASPTYNPNCLGADTSGDIYPNGVVYSLSFYNYKYPALQSVCNALIDNVLIDGVFTAPDRNKECNTRYCYAHYMKDECNYWASDFIPSGKDWIISSYKTQQSCTDAVDNIKYSASSWAFPSPAYCSMDKWCYLKTITPTDTPTDNNQDPNDNNSSSGTSNSSNDSNSSSYSILPIVESINKTNEKLDSTNTKLDAVNLNLSDIKTTSQDSKNLLDKISKNSMTSNANESESLNRLASMNSILSDSKNTLKAFSDVATSNQVLANGHLEDISGKMSTNNALLSGIKDSIDGDGSSPDTSAFDGFEGALSEYSAYIDTIKSQYSTFSDNASSSFSEVETQYNNALSLFKNPLSAPALSGSYNASCFSFDVFGKHVVLDMSVLSAISPVVYFITTLGFMLLNFRFLLNHLLRGND